MTRDARDQMLKMKLKLLSVASVGPELSALKAIYCLKASLKPFQSCFRCITSASFSGCTLPQRRYMAYSAVCAAVGEVIQHRLLRKAAVGDLPIILGSRGI